ncbi:MAG: flagellar motor switch phosphatase FliY [Clostridiaceae bacterium]|nr:flagellar motor switch phosphatase FliY [Clostridiaceae bacterium]
MDSTLSQAEIDALLNTGNVLNDEERQGNEPELSEKEIDTLGEIGNISIGTSATTLFALLGHKVLITTPKVSVTTWEKLAKEHPLPYVAVRVEYTKGLKGINLLILKEEDVKVITDLMMGGGGVASEGELTDMHLSAISEAMNQMIGSAATSMSTMFNRRIEISPPRSFIIKFDTSNTYEDYKKYGALVKIAFKMVVEGYINSEIMQLIPIDFAKEMVETLHGNQYEKLAGDNEMEYFEKPKSPGREIKGEPGNGQEKNRGLIQKDEEQVSIQPAHFLPFEEDGKTTEKQDISLIVDIPLEVTVELGKTQKLVKEVLGFGYGTIIELDKLAGDTVDILVNGKKIARGEVVVIDDNFGVRITDIVHPSKRF